MNVYQICTYWTCTPRVLVRFLPADTLSYILVHLSEFGLQIGQKPMQQLRHPPFLLSQTPLQHIQMAAQ